jgi:hypothetical protein
MPMRRALALAVTAAFAITGVASAETWTKFATMENGAEVSYDKDYTYKDRQSGRLIVMQALSKGALGPSAPGKPDSVGSLVAIDCSSKNMISMASYRPNVALEVKSSWRNETPKKITGSDNEALAKAVCAEASSAPVR